MTVFMTLRQSPVGGSVKSPTFLQAAVVGSTNLSNLPDEIFVSRSAGRDVLFATHGFNVNQADGCRSLGRLEAMLALPSSCLFVGVLWPGDFWIPAVNYPFEGDDAKKCGRLVADFCNRRLRRARSLSFISHSLGARLVLEAVKNLGRPAESVCLAAGAIDNDCLTNEYAKAFANAKAISVLASRKDRVLQIAYPLGDPIADFLQLHQNPARVALGREGPPQPVGATLPPWQIPDADDYGHGDYLPPSAAAAQFPNPNGKWVKISGFMKEVFQETRRTWPP